MLRYISVLVVKMLDDGRRFPLETQGRKEAVRGLHGLDPDHLLCQFHINAALHSQLLSTF